MRYAAVTAQGNTLTLKVAKEGSAGPEALTSAQLSAFQGYVNSIKPLGIYVTAVSGDANLLQLHATIIYNPEITLQTIQTNVPAAIDQFCHEMEFGGTLYLGRLAAAVMRVEGVVDFAISSAALINGSMVSTTNPTPETISNNHIVPFNGHCRLDTSAATQFTYSSISSIS